MGRLIHQEVTLDEETVRAERNAAPLFASPWLAFFSLLRENLVTQREGNEVQI